MSLHLPTHNNLKKTNGIKCTKQRSIQHKNLRYNTSLLNICSFYCFRFFAICYPMKVRTICTTRRAKIVIPILWITGIAISIPMGFDQVRLFSFLFIEVLDPLCPLWIYFCFTWNKVSIVVQLTWAPGIPMQWGLAMIQLNQECQFTAQPPDHQSHALPTVLGHYLVVDVNHQGLYKVVLYWFQK